MSARPQSKPPHVILLDTHTPPHPTFSVSYIEALQASATNLINHLRNHVDTNPPNLHILSNTPSALQHILHPQSNHTKPISLLPSILNSDITDRHLHLLITRWRAIFPIHSHALFVVHHAFTPLLSAALSTIKPAPTSVRILSLHPENTHLLQPPIPNIYASPTDIPTISTIFLQIYAACHDQPATLTILNPDTTPLCTLPLHIRPRVQTALLFRHTRLTALFRAYEESVPEDVATGPPHILWDPAANSAPTNRIFDALSRSLRASREILICSYIDAAAAQSGFAALIPPATRRPSAPMMLVRNLAHLDTLLQAPVMDARVVSPRDVAIADLALKQLDVRAFRVQELPDVGGAFVQKDARVGEGPRGILRAAGRSAGPGNGVGRRVNFGATDDEAGRRSCA